MISARTDETRSALAGLSPRSAFAPSLPASSGGWPVGAVVAAFSALVLVLGLSTTAPDGATAHELSVLLRDGPQNATSGTLWAWIVVLFEQLPFGPSSVWRISLASALCTATAAGLLAVWLRQRDVGRRAAVSAGMLFAFALPVWQSAVTPSGAPVAAMLALLALVLLEEGVATRKRSPRLAGWCLVGVAATQGPIALGSIAAVVVAESLPRGTWSRPRISSFLATALGFAVALFIFGGVSAFTAPYIPHSSGWIPAGPADALAEAARQSGPTGVVALLGLLILWWRHPGDAGSLTLLGSMALLAPLAIGARENGTGEPAPFVAAIPLTFAACAALAGAAIDAILQRYAATPNPRSHALTALTAALPLAVIVLGAPIADRSDWRYGEEWAHSVLASLPENAVLFTARDPRGGLLEWVQLTEGTRPDVVIADPAGSIDPRRSPILDIEPRPKSPGAAISAVRAMTDRPIFSIDPIPTANGRWTPWALAWRWAPSDEASAEDSAEAWKSVRFTHLPSTPSEARAWIGGELDVPTRDATAMRIAADYFQAIARRDGKLSQIGPWATVLERVGSMRGEVAPPRRETE